MELVKMESRPCSKSTIIWWRKNIPHTLVQAVSGYCDILAMNPG